MGKNGYTTKADTKNKSRAAENRRKNLMKKMIKMLKNLREVV